MSDLGREIASTVRVDWSELRAETVWVGVGPRRRRRIVARIGVACVLAAVMGGVALRSRDERPQSPRAALANLLPTVRLEREEPTTPPSTATAMIAPLAPHGVPIRVQLGPGRRHFDVADQPYEIRSGSITIEAHNATFACSRSERSTRVEVYRGTVLVREAAGTRELAVGDSVEIRTSAHQPVDPVIELLHTADVMRLAKQPGEAIGPLRRIVADHPSDPRASLAAFTLGRLLLDELGRPRDAAAAFADAIRLAPNGDLVEDALARQVDALARAGDTDAARDLAETYTRRFPRGRRLQGVRAAGGLP